MLASNSSYRPWSPATTPLQLAMVMFFFSPALGASEPKFCAFEILIRNPSGRSSAGVLVHMVRKGVSLAEQRTDLSGIAKICDAPIDYVDFVVGSDLCGASLVQHVKQSWPETNRLSVSYQERPCDHLGLARRCLVLIRVRDDLGNPIEGGRLEVEALNVRPDPSDSLGRIFMLIPRRTLVKGIVIKDGRRSSLAIDCTDDVELVVILRKPEEQRDRKGREGQPQ